MSREGVLMEKRMGLSSQAESVRPVLTVWEGDPISKAARSMQCYHVGSLVVVDKAGDMVGILTERDILNCFASRDKWQDEVCVVEAMTKDVVSVVPGTPIKFADEIMAGHGIRHLPVVDNGRAVGMISARDVMAARLGIARALKNAAEEIALLSSSVREPDLQDLLNRMAIEIPKVFGAKRWALYLASEDYADDGEPLIQRMNCPCGVDELSHRAKSMPLACDGPLAVTNPPGVCQRLGAMGCNATMFLTQSAFGCELGHRSEGGLSFLCMCGLPEVTEESAEVLRYKLALVANTLTVNLANARLYRAAYRDPLTGLLARRAMAEALADEHSRALRHGLGFCVAMLDVDNFKIINDTYGHAAGDDVLKQLGEVLRAGARAHDLPARHGGDEVAVLMPETKIDGALPAVERLRLRLERELRAPGGRPVTVSCGIAEWSGLGDDTGADVVRRADEALYEAKRKGRNCVVVANPVPAARL